MRFTLQPVKGMGFINRTELLEEMVAELEEIESTIGYALYGKRRIGKTSVLKEVQKRLENEDRIVTVYISVWDLIEGRVDEFCQKLSMDIIDAYRPHTGLKYKAGELIRTPLAVLRKFLDGAEFRIVYDELEFFLTLEKNIDRNLLVEHAFNLAEKFAEETDTKCILLLDEFPSIVELKSEGAMVGEQILRKIRTLFESWERTALCISGSIGSTMNLTVLSSTSPFYRQLVMKEIGPLKKEAVKELLLRNLEITDAGIEQIYEFSAGIPFYVQFIGKMIEKNGTATIEDIKEIEREFLREEGDLLFKGEFNDLSSKERLVILCIAKGCHTPKEIATIVKDKVSNVSRFLAYLEAKGYISRKEKGYYVLEDPVFGMWLGMR
ncbi:MAG: putative ATP-binding protein [Candidatus Methanogaster sp.]|nr:MAG: putative ATP-binding protein [ANME-2 cluster archaeon]